jgi:putative DNA methylase
MSSAQPKKLIEVALPLEDINREAAREKSIRHGHPSTLHLWWARRPLAACRAVLFASLVDDPSEHTQELLADGAKRRAAESLFKARKKAWQERKATSDKARAAGMTSVPDPGPEPTVEEIVVEQERERLFDIIRELVKWENSNNERVLQAARAEILRSCHGKPPPVYDPFCGGGSIPLEAQRLGLEAHASDLNPVAVLITKALIEIPPKFAGKPPVHPLTTDYADNTAAEKKSSVKSVSSAVNQTGSWKGAAGLAEDIRYYGKWMRDEAEKRIGHLYPKVKLPKEHGGGEATVIAWLWARTVASPNPAAKGAHVPLVRSFWLSTKPGKKAWVEPVVDQSTMTYRFEVRTGNGEPRPGTVSRNGGICLLTGSPMPLEYVRAEGKAGRFGARLLAIVAEGSKARVYLAPTDEHECISQCAPPENPPDTDLPEEALGFRVQNYGMTKHRHLFTNRQLVALTTFADLVGEARQLLCNEGNGDEAYANAVATYLAFAVSKSANYWSSICKWHQAKELVVSTFGLPVLPMTWDYIETNPFSASTGNWISGVNQAAKSVALTPANSAGFAGQADASVPKNPKVPWVVCTDPPYYDNVPYADLSDFFYIWLRRILGGFYPDLLSTLLVPKASELIADPFRHGGKVEAQRFFEDGLSKTFEIVRAESSPEFPFTVFYAFKQQESNEESDAEQATGSVSSTGWGTMLEGLTSSGFSIEGTWPVRTEQPGGLREAGRNALASSIVLVCRPRTKEAGVASRRDFLAALRRELPEALRNLQKGNIAPVDLAQAAIGPGMAVFSRYAKVMESDGSAMKVRAALAEINKCLDEVLAEQEGEFDADTRWALAWFEQYGFTEGPYGTAETLSTAKNTSVDGMKEAGILLARAGKVRLLRAEELAADWDPVTDERLTMWEVTHYLIRELDAGGSQSAGGLLARLTPLQADAARDLAYRLYSLCERRKWAKEALAYNALVTTWGEVGRQASEVSTAMLKQTDLGM